MSTPKAPSMKSHPLPQKKLTISILEAYYTFVAPLHLWLCATLGSAYENEQGRFTGIQDFLDTTYVGCKTNPRRLKLSPSMSNMREVVDQAQFRLFNQARTNTILTLGYRIAYEKGVRGKRVVSRDNITNHFLNTTIAALQNPEWEALLEIIGEDAILDLLIATSIFLPLPNGCFCQITGEPLIHLIPIQATLPQPDEACKAQRGKKRRPAGIHRDAPPLKKAKASSAAYISSKGKEAIQTREVVTPADLMLQRLRLFYCRPSFVPHAKDKHVVGLPVRHILNVFHPVYDGKLAKQPIPDRHTLRTQAQRLSKYVFPRQYGLESRFCQARSTLFVDYSDREPELKKKGSLKTPNRLKPALPLLEKVIKRHRKCAYKQLRDRFCPTKVPREGSNLKHVDETVILEMMSETSLPLRSQASAAHVSVASATPNTTLSQGRKNAKLKPRFVEFACSHSQVYRYAVAITEAVIPKSFWGSQANFDLICRHIQCFVSSRRHENMSLHYLVEGFSTTSCDWLIPPGEGPSLQARISVSDALKRREMLEEFILWYFDSFLLLLLKTTFYVTESSAFRYKVLYFRQDDWKTLCQPLISNLTKGTFEKISKSAAEELTRQGSLGYSFVRLLPKETGVRPIVNLRRKKATTVGPFTVQQSINQILQAAFAILNYEKKLQPENIGASVMGRNEIYQKLLAFKGTLSRNPTGALPKLYFVKVDVQACFDTIEQSKLLQILRDLISEDVYRTHKYGQVGVSSGKIRRMYIKNTMTEDDHPFFLHYAEGLAATLRNMVFSDQVVYPATTKGEVLELLEEHITDNIVKIGQSYFRQVVGIPQGSVLSTLLCCFFYGDLEKRFGTFRNDPQSLLLRLIDDYLFVTTDVSKARNFLKMMSTGFPEYGCQISRDKSMTNFECPDYVQNVVGGQDKYFPWCGLLIDMHTLSIAGDYTRYEKCGIKSTLSVGRGRKSGSVFLLKLLQAAKAKSHPIFSDAELNTEHAVLLNVYQNMLLAARKMCEYLSDWDKIEKRNQPFLRSAIRRAVLYSYTSMHVQARRKGRPGPVVRKEDVTWLGTHAFVHVLRQQGRKYAAVASGLADDIEKSRYKRCRARFTALIEEGQTVFERIRG